MGKAIIDRNSKARASEQWGLKGLMIGNGWISPEDQRDSYLKYSLQKGIVEEGSTEAMALGDMQQKCDVALATNPDHVSYVECDAILQRIMEFTKTADNKCVNIYDVRLTDSFPSCGMNWPPDLDYVGPYLRRMDVIGALNLNRQRNAGWEECNNKVGNNFRNRNSTPSVHLLPEILKQVPVLLFSGAEDLICNYLGTEATINNLEWNGGKGFEVTPGNWAPRRDWTFEGEGAGFWQEARNLTYVQFYDASHMVPFDYPRRSRDMLDRFMKVDISDIGGMPSDSRIDGEKGPDTSVGDATNNTQTHQEEAKKKLAQAKWDAYQRSGEVVLVIVIIAATAWGYFVWRQRRKGAAYAALRGEPGASRSGSGLVAFNRRHGDQDLEAEAFDETTIDSIPLQSSIHDDHHHYSVGDDSDDDGYEKPDDDKK